MAGRFQAPITPSLPELNAQALAGDADAARLLAERSTTCMNAWDFVKRFVPPDEAGRALEVDDRGRVTLRIFDLYVDAFQRSRQKALLDTLELPKVEQSNLNEGWTG